MIRDNKSDFCLSCNYYLWLENVINCYLMNEEMTVIIAWIQIKWKVKSRSFPFGTKQSNDNNMIISDPHWINYSMAVINSSRSIDRCLRLTKTKQQSWLTAKEDYLSFSIRHKRLLRLFTRYPHFIDRFAFIIAEVIYILNRSCVPDWTDRQRMTEPVRFMECQ